MVNPQARSSFLLVGDHAGNAIPAALGDLGLPANERVRHIAWDIGVADVGTALAERLDATFIHQAYSRLVIDCNRDVGAPDSIAETSDGTVVPRNQRLPPEALRARQDQIHAPYQAAIGAELARRDAEGRQTVLIALHSFTPVMRGVARPWDIGILHHGGDPAFALRMLERLRALPGLVVGDNEPYRMDLIDYTIPRWAYPARRPYAEIEMRQDLVSSPEGVARWVSILCETLAAAQAESSCVQRPIP